MRIIGKENKFTAFSEDIMGDIVVLNQNTPS